MKREVMKLEVSSGRGGKFILVGGPRPYIWVGLADSCVGVVSDRSVKKLKRWCEEILEKRKRK